MCTINMTFEVPESKAIDIEALKSQLNDIFKIIVSSPSVLKKENPISWTEDFRGEMASMSINEAKKILNRRKLKSRNIPGNFNGMRDEVNPKYL